MSLPSGLVKSHAPLIRLVLYFLLGLWSSLLFLFCVARLAYTLTPRSERSPIDWLPFYDPSVVELLVCSVLGFGFSIFMFITLRSRQETEYTSRNSFEVSFLFLLWMLWLGGASAASTAWSDLSSCAVYSSCQTLQALMGWAWLGWLCLTFLFIPTLWVVGAARNWHDNFFDTWNYDRSAIAHSNSGGRRIPDTGLPPVLGQPALQDPQEKALQSRVERELQARERVWNLDKEAAKMRARLNSWIGHRRQSRDVRVAIQVDLEHGGPYLHSRQAHLDKTQEANSLPPSPPLPPNGALRLNVEGAANTTP